jgi:hypothetical protein
VIIRETQAWDVFDVGCPLSGGGWSKWAEYFGECLAAGEALPSLERRHAEDQLGESVYSGTPGPEQQLLALAHIMLSRGLLGEEDLARRMIAVRSRLETS